MILLLLLRDLNKSDKRKMLMLKQFKNDYDLISLKFLCEYSEEACLLYEELLKMLGNTRKLESKLLNSGHPYKLADLENIVDFLTTQFSPPSVKIKDLIKDL